MFCPSCGKQNREDVSFCAFCGVVLPKDNPPATSTPISQPHASFQQTPVPKPAKARLSFNAVKAIVTGILIVGLIVAILQVYYPAVLPWNW